jgi:hypothetical protein
MEGMRWNFGSGVRSRLKGICSTMCVVLSIKPVYYQGLVMTKITRFNVDLLRTFLLQH